MNIAKDHAKSVFEVFLSLPCVEDYVSKVMTIRTVKLPFFHDRSKKEI